MLQGYKVHDSPLTCLCQSTSGKHVLSSGSEDSTVRLSALSEENPSVSVLKDFQIGTTFDVSDIAYNASDNQFFAVSYNRTVEYHEMHSDRVLNSGTASSQINCLSAVENDIIYAGCRGGVEVFDLRLKNQPRSAFSLDSDFGEVTCVGLCPWQDCVLCCGTSSGFLEYYDLRNAKKLMFNVDYIYGGHEQLGIAQLEVAEEVYIMLEDNQGPEKVVRFNSAKAGNEISAEFNWTRRAGTYQTQFAVVENDMIVIGDGLEDGRVLVVGSHAMPKVIEVGPPDSIITKVSNQNGQGVVSDNHGYIYSFQSISLL